MCSVIHPWRHLQHFNDDFIVVEDVDAFEYFAVLASAQFADQLIVVLIPKDVGSHGSTLQPLPPLYWVRFVVPVVSRLVSIYVRVNSGKTARYHSVRHCEPCWAYNTRDTHTQGVGVPKEKVISSSNN